MPASSAPLACDKYQTVAFDSNRYSVPRPFAYQTVTVKGYVDQVVIVSGSELIATHARSMERGTIVPTRSTISRPWAASPEHSTIRRCTATGSFLPASPRFAPTWNNTTARRPARGATCGSCNSWANIPSTACVRPLRTAGVRG